MNTQSPWHDPEFVYKYANKAGNLKQGWYEHEVNFPSLAALVPPTTKRLLDFGCGFGEFTARLAQKYTVVGCDNSPVILEIAHKKYPNVDFFLWNFQDELPKEYTVFDTIFSKLAIHFIEDLGAFAAAMHRILAPLGVLVMSVPHPAYTAKQTSDYWQQAEYRMQLSDFGIYDTMIHRSLEHYMLAFFDKGFVLTGLAEPKPSQESINTHGADPSGFVLPKRLNLRLQKL